jgi:tRNA A-37 threonylcarbamoyl transferase component Bud32
LKSISHDAWLKLRQGAEIIQRDKFGEKVLLLPDGTYIKLFRRKRLLSSAAWSPYAQRFADNSLALQRAGIPCPQVIEVFRISEIARDAVHYHPLAGETLRDVLQKPADAIDRSYLRDAFNLFVRRLHDLGIYFRSLHLGNVVLMSSGELGLIDISDIRVHKRPLSMFWRKRNLNRMEGFPEEREWLDRAIILDPRHKPPAGRLK